MNKKEHLIDFLKFSIENDYKERQEAIILIIALVSASFFLYSQIFSKYGFDTIANLACIFVLVNSTIAIVFLRKITLMLQSEKKIEKSIKGFGLVSLSWIVVVLLITYFFFNNYFLLVLLLIPMNYTLRYSIFYLRRFLILYFRDDLKMHFIYKVINSEIEEKDIYLDFVKLQYLSLTDIVFELFKTSNILTKLIQEQNERKE